MAIYKEQTKFTLLSGAEVAVVGWHWESGVDAATLAAAIDARIASLWTGWKDEFHSSVSMTQRDLFEYNLGTGALVSTTPLALPSGTAGTLSGNPLPPQLTTAISLRTAQPGPRGRGRFYLPAGSTAILAADGLIPLVTRQDLVDSFAGYVGLIESDVADTQLSVWSKTHADAHDVTLVQAGSVWDTQRRRRSGLPESRYSVAV